MKITKIKNKQSGEIFEIGADVVVNPTLDGEEEELSSLGIDGKNYKVGGSGSSGGGKTYYKHNIKAAFWCNDLDEYAFFYITIINSNPTQITADNLVEYIKEMEVVSVAVDMWGYYAGVVCKLYDDEENPNLRLKYVDEEGFTEYELDISDSDIQEEVTEL